MLFAGLCLALATSATPARADEQTPDVLNALHILDYIGVDYAGAVRDGNVIVAGEYQEQKEFAAEVGRALARIQAPAELRQQSAALEKLIAGRASSEQVRSATRMLSSAVLAAYPISIAPKRAPDVASAGPLYQEHCSSCHGASGAGDGPAAAGLSPAPADFLDNARQKQRSVFALYNTLNTGVAGTAMPSFAKLSEDERWTLAFYVGQLRYNDAQRTSGQQQWTRKSEAARAVADLKTLSNTEPAQLETRFGADGAAVMAYLCAHPEAVEDRREPLLIASTKLKASADAYAAGQRTEASQIAVSAYLDGFELAEAQLATVDEDLMKQIERAMMGYRELVKSEAAPTQVTQAQRDIEEQLQTARERLAGGAQSAAGSFVGSFVILAREGLEAILVLAAMFAFLRRTERKDALPYVHAGWIAALLLGLATWAASNWLVGISGAGRELTEGLTALFAAAILLSVGLWMHNKSYSNRWQQYVAGKMRGALAGGRPWGLCALAFIAVYREVFEVVLFYRALWSQGDHLAIVLGLVAAAVALLALTWAIFALSMKLPIGQFFAWSSGLIVVLAVVFTGKGVAALQEAGTMSVHAVTFVRIPLLGIYPNQQGLLLQALVLSAVLGGFGWNHLQARRGVSRD